MITLEQAKAQLRVTHDAEDEEIRELILEAEQAIVLYLKSYADSFTDSSGTVPRDTAFQPLVDVPPVVQRACKIQVGEWYKNREGQTENDIGGVLGIPAGYGYLSRAVVAVLYPLRVPTLA